MKLVGWGAAAASVLPACGDNIQVTRGVFFDEGAWATIDLATDIVFPGARDCRAVRYIDQLLAAFDVAPPAIYAAGPFSGRAPFPDAHGQPTDEFPANDFTRHVPLSRVKEIAWRMRIFGSAQTPGATFNDALLGPTIGWRDLYLDGVRRLDEVAKTLEPERAFRFLQPENQSLALDTVASDKPEFWQMLVEHTLEGTFGAPEYGGNADLQGWELVRFDGDSAPLGHAVYDQSSDAYVDNRTRPTTQPSPGDTTEDFDPEVVNLLVVAAIGSGGKRFF